MFEFIATLFFAMGIMIVLMAVGVALTMPFHGALVRLRANYNPRAVGLEGTDNRCVSPLASSMHSAGATWRRGSPCQGRPDTDDPVGHVEADQEPRGLVRPVQG